MNNTHHMAVLRGLRNRLAGEEKSSLRYALNRIEALETKLKTINRMSFIKRDAEGEIDPE
jgi:hypothetical protein